MSTSVSQLIAEVELPPEVAADIEPLLLALRSATPTAAPAPSAELAAFLARPSGIVAYRPRRRALVAAAAAMIGTFGLTGVAAAANQLPEPAQRLVSELSSRYLPFEFPQPIEPEPTFEPVPVVEGDGEPSDLPPSVTEEAVNPPQPSEAAKPRQQNSPDTGAESTAQAPQPSEKPSPIEPDPSVDPSVPTDAAPTGEPSGSPSGSTSPSAGGSSSPSSGETGPSFARDNETTSPAPRPSGTTSPSSSTSPSGSTSPAG